MAGSAKKKCRYLQEVNEDLQNKNLISSNVEEALQKTTSKAPSQLFERLAKRVNTSKKSPRKYSKDLKSFVVPLQFYSSKVYNYVCNTFNLSLTHENTVYCFS